MKKIPIIEVISFITIVLFLYTGINKLIDYSTFKEQIALSPILQPFAAVIAWLLPLLEFATAILLFIPIWRLYGFHLAFALMIIFTIYIAAILSIDKNLPCSCGGIIELLSWQQHLLINCLLMAMEFVGLIFQKKYQSECAQRFIISA